MCRRVTAALTAAVVTLILATGGAASSNGLGQQYPSLTPPSISGTTRVPSLLTASTGTWQGKNLTSAYQWLRCDSVGANCGAIGGATGSSHTLTTADVGFTLRVTMVATNRYGSAAATSAAWRPAFAAVRVTHATQQVTPARASVPPATKASPRLMSQCQIG